MGKKTLMALVFALLFSVGMVACGASSGEKVSDKTVTTITSERVAVEEATTTEAVEKVTADEAVPATEAAVRVRIGRMALSYPHVPAALFGEMPFLEENGVTNYEIKPFTKGSKASLALGLGEIDVAFLGAIVPAVANGLPAKVVALNGIRGAQIACMTPGIDSLEDLRGKKLGHIGPTASPTTIARMALKEAGIPQDDVEYVHINRTNIVLALTEKKVVDCAIMMEPLTGQAVKNGAYVAIDEREIYNDGNYPLTFFAVRTDFIENHRGIVENLLAAHAASQQFISENREETLALMNSYFESSGLEISREDLVTGLDANIFTQTVSRAVMEDMVAVMVESGIIDKPIPFDQLVDCSFGLCTE